MDSIGCWRERLSFSSNILRRISKKFFLLSNGWKTALENRPSTPSASGLFFGLEDSVAEYLLEAIHRVDQLDREKPLSSSDLQSLVDQYHIASIEIYNAKGNPVKGWPSPISSPEKKFFLQELIEKKRPVAINLFGKLLAEDPLFSIAIWRRGIPEIIALHLNGEQVKRLLGQFAIQRAISDIGLREGILYISVQDTSLNTLAHMDPTLIGKRDEDPFLKNALQSNRVFSRHYQSDPERRNL